MTAAVLVANVLADDPDLALDMSRGCCTIFQLGIAYDFSQLSIDGFSWDSRLAIVSGFA